ncbi:MAG: YitT family protein [Clostridia bacterium]|nr:YitT family protein [Clostridia bacterium]
MKKPTAAQLLKKYAIITLGSLIYAASVALFLDPNNIAPGGVSGIAIIISSFTESIPTGTWIIILNVPILFAGTVLLGGRFLLSTIYSVGVSSLAMNLLTAYVKPVTDDLLLAAVAGGMLMAVGLGLVFRERATTGGSDVIVRMLKLKFRHFSTGAVFLITDGMIVAATLFAFGRFEITMYAAICLMIQSFLINRILYGFDEARIVYIISDKDHVIGRRLLTELNAGATYLSGEGAYTSNDKEVLMCVVKMRALPEVRELVRQEDEAAFMFVTKATSVFGEGFRDHNDADL